MRKLFGGALLLTATSALCTTNTANANCNTILVYDNGFPNVCVVVASQVNDTVGADPAGADDFTVFATGMKVTDIHWYAAEPTASGIGFSGSARVTVYNALGGCGGPDKAAIVYQEDSPATATIVSSGQFTVGGVSHDMVRYDIEKLVDEIKLNGSGAGTKYWISLQPISSGTAPGDSLWMSTRCEVNGDVLVGCGAWSDPDTSVAGGWSVVEVPAAGDEIDLNFQLTRCDTFNCPWNLATVPAASEFVIDVFDLFILLDNWNTNGPGADFAPPNNVVDVFDLFVLLDNWNQICPPNGTNNSCAFASLLIGPGTSAYNTAGATADGPNDGAGCTPPIPNNQNDIWFCWKSECEGFTNVTLSGAHAIRVYAGGGTSCGDCGALGAPVACSNTGTVRFLATQGNHYRIRISGSNVSGNMTIDDCEPFNDDCEDAIVILTGDIVTGTLAGFTPDPSVPNCVPVDPGNSLGDTPGVWYVTIGDGSDYTATTCFSSPAPAQPDRIAVFCGTSCDGLQPNCVLLAGDDQPCGLQPPGTQANVTWCTVEGVIYFIYLSMDNNVNTPGPFQLGLTSSGSSCTPTSFEAGCPGIPGDVCAMDQDTSRGIGSGLNCQIPDQDGHGADGILAATSDRNPGFGFTVADDFTVTSSGPINSVCWWGIYNDFTAGVDCAPGDGAGGIDDFRIRIYSHNVADGLPLSMIQEWNIGALTLNSEKIYSGNDTGGIREEWEFTAPLSPAFSATAGTCYWLEISNNTLASCAWLWVTTAPGNERSAQDTTLDGYNSGECSDYDLSWCINRDLGNITAACGGPGCACFEPVACTLSGYYQCPNFGTAYTSDPAIGSPASNILVADNFVVSGAGQSVTGVCWWGLYLSFSGGFAACNTEPPANATYTITFYEDAGTLPGTVIATRTLVDPAQTDTGINIIDDVFEFTASIAPVNLSAFDGDIVWMSIQLNPNQTCEFLWVDSNVGDQLLARNTNGAGWGIGAADDLAFRLNIAASEPGPPPPPANDDCANATNIGNGTTAYSTIGATTDGPDNGSPNPCNDFGETQTNEDIWYRYVATCNGTLRVSTCEDYGGSATYDTDLVVYNTHACPTNNTNRLACNDDDAGAVCGTTNFHSKVDVTVTNGQNILIRVGGWGPGDEGTGNLFISCTP